MVIAAALVLVLALVAMVLGSYQVIFRRPLPRTTGEIEVDGLKAPVEIRRDRRGVPHIRAADRRDGAFAVGFAHGQDRSWQMELQRRTAAGRLCEVVGERGLPIDRLMRRLGLRRISEAEWHVTHAAGELRDLVEAYSEGVNAAINDRPLPAEFTILRHRPEPWEPEDTLAVGRLLSFVQAGNWEAQLVRMRMLKELGPELTAALDPTYPSDHPRVPAADDRAMGVVTEDLLEQLAAAQELLPLSAWGSASNTWVVHGSRTATGDPILANDPHGALTAPSSWYQLRLETPEDELAGLTFVGTPFVAFGHNRRVAWGLVNAQVSIQDLFVERLNPNNPLQFEDRGGWQDAMRFREVVHVRGGRPRVEDVLVTRRGPIISGPLGGTQPPLSLRWVGFDSEVDSLSWMMRLNQALDWKSFRYAIGSCSSPALVASYADVDGNIGFRLSGFIPLRSAGAGRLPSAGWDPTGEWQGYIPFEEMPESLNPASGLIVAANNPIAYTSHPLVTEAGSGFRAQRILQCLGEGTGVSVDDCVALQADVQSLPGIRLSRLLVDRLGSASVEPRLGPALTILAGWDGRLDTDSAGAAIYERTLERLADRFLAGSLSPALRELVLGGSVHPLSTTGPFEGRIMPTLIEALEQGRAVPAVEPSAGARDALLQEALGEAVDELSRSHGPNPRRWRWGDDLQVRFDHPLATAFRPLARILNRGPFAGAGDNHTVRLMGRGLGQAGVGPTAAALCRGVYDLGDWSRSVFSHVPGQSGHPASANYADLIPGWLDCRPLPMAFGDGAHQEGADGERVLWLRPRAGGRNRA